MGIIKLLIKYIKRLFTLFDSTCTKALLHYYGVENDGKIRTYGIPFIRVEKRGVFTIGRDFSVNNSYKKNVIGRQQKSAFIVLNDAELAIGSNVGISSSTIVCKQKVIIKNNVRLGGNVCIYDTDFHSLDYTERCSIPEITTNVKSSPVIIEDNVFVGAHSTILKGVTIGKNSIIGACSVVTRSIPTNEIWAGNPAKFIRRVSE